MRFLAALAGLILAASAQAQPVTPGLLREIAPTGRLRAAINDGNPVLVTRAKGGRLSGISVDLAEELGRRLGLPVDLVPFDAAGKVTEAAGRNVWDIAFLAVDPKRGEGMAFTAPYLLIEGTYMVRSTSPLREIADVDRTGARIAVGRGSAYDLFLSREIRQATLVRATTSSGSIEMFVRDGLDAAAGVRQSLVAFARDHEGYRVIDGRFMAIGQAMGVPQGRPAAIAYLKAFVEEMKRSGFVAAAASRHRQPDAAVAPAVP